MNNLWSGCVHGTPEHRCVIVAALSIVTLVTGSVLHADTVSDYGQQLVTGWHADDSAGNGNFAVTFASPPPLAFAEMGLKAHNTAGGELSQFQGTYYALPGTSNNQATWNLDVSAAMSYQSYNGQPMFPTVWKSVANLGMLAEEDDQVDYGGPAHHHTFAQNAFKLHVDFDPAEGNAGRGVINFSSLVADAYALGVSGCPDPAETFGVQVSHNLVSALLTNPDIWEVAPVVGPASFDPNAPGSYEYTLTLEAITGPYTGQTYAQTDIVVEVIPEPASAVLLVTAAGLTALRRRRGSGRRD